MGDAIDPAERLEAGGYGGGRPFVVREIGGAGDGLAPRRLDLGDGVGRRAGAGSSPSLAAPLSATTTLAPRAASSSACARPRPRPAPVTSMARPSNRISPSVMLDQTSRLPKNTSL